MKRAMLERRAAMRTRLGPWVERRLLPALGLGGTFQLDLASEGTRTIVLFVTTARGEYVVKCHTSPLRALRLRNNLRHLEARGAPAPRIVFSDFSPLTWLRYGCVVIVEERVKGGVLRRGKRTPERIAAAARALAALHRITSDRWGHVPPLPRRKRGFFAAQTRRLNRRLREFATSLPEYPAYGRPEIEAWFASQRALVESVPAWSLCHLRVSSTNVLLRGDEVGDATLIDFMTVRYSHHALDVERALHRWCRDEPEATEAFLAAYFEAFTLVTRQQWEASRDWFHAAFHVTQASGRLAWLKAYGAYLAGKVKVSGGHRRALKRRADALSEHLRAALKIIARAQGGALGDELNRMRKAMRPLKDPARWSGRSAVNAQNSTSDWSGRRTGGIHPAQP